eukprot:scaffold57429_cov27-Tisochrysis_lutea.AAC.2
MEAVYSSSCMELRAQSTQLLNCCDAPAKVLPAAAAAEEITRQRPSASWERGAAPHRKLRRNATARGVPNICE